MAILSGLGSATAGEAWSFKEYPHPVSSEMSDAENAQITRETKKNDSSSYCERAVRAEYAIYQQRFPEFAMHAELPGMRDKWRQSILIVSPRSYLPTCLYEDLVSPMYHFNQDPKTPDFLFCGKYTRQAQSNEEKQMAARIQDLLVLLQDGQISAQYFLVKHSEAKQVIALNPDVEYYIRLVVSDYLGIFVFSDVSHLTPQLSVKHRALLDEALERKDLDWVLETTAECTEGSGD